MVKKDVLNVLLLVGLTVPNARLVIDGSILNASDAKMAWEKQQVSPPNQRLKHARFNAIQPAAVKLAQKSPPLASFASREISGMAQDAPFVRMGKARELTV